MRRIWKEFDQHLAKLESLGKLRKLETFGKTGDDNAELDKNLNIDFEPEAEAAATRTDEEEEVQEEHEYRTR